MLEVQRRRLADEGKVASFRVLEYHLLSVSLGLAMKNPQRARASLDGILKQQLNPDSIEFCMLWRIDALQAGILALEGQLKQAEATLRGLLKTIEARDEAHYWTDHVGRARFALGEVLRASGLAEEARPELRAAAEVFGKTQVAELSLDLA